MSTSIVLPASMDKGTIARWVRTEGELVKVGDVLAEIETDKAMVDLESVEEGVLARIMIPQGTTEVAGGTVLAILNGASQPSERSTRLFASPRARRLAREAGIELKELSGSGPHGRIIERDIETARSLRAGNASHRAEERHSVSISERPLSDTYVEVPHDSLRKSIARRLQESKQKVPHFYLSIDCELDALLTLKEQFNGLPPALAGGGVANKLTLNDFIVKAWSLAIGRVPDANVSWTDDALLKHGVVDVAVAVAVPGGVITPIVRRADNKRLMEISIEMKELSARAVARKLSSDEYVGGATAISNLGMFGIKSFSAILNPPHSTILAVGVGEKRVVVKDNASAIATVMTCTLSADHRAVDGAVGARLLAEFKRHIENPLSLCA